MSVLDRDALSDSPLADLHAIASELGIDGFRRLKKDDLIDAILERQGGDSGSAAKDAKDDDDAEAKPRRRRPRGGRGRKKKDDEDDEAATDAVADEDAEDEPEEKPKPRRRSRAAKDDDDGGPKASSRGRARKRDADHDSDDEEEEATVEGKLELTANGSGFVKPTEGDDEEVYVSAAQVRRCELVDGDVVGGPVRAPRRSERHPSLIRVETINGKPADEVAGGTHYEDLAVTYPSARIEMGSDDPTLKAIEWLTPFGRGSRVTVVGATGAGKTEAIKLLAAALGAIDGLEVSVVLAGARPEEIAAWADGPAEVAGAASFAASADQQATHVERAIEVGKRIAARGGDAVVLIDGLDGVPPHVARRVLASARNLAESGSLTVIAAASRPVGGETTVIALDARLTGARSWPALDLLGSSTLRADLLVGDAGAEAIARARGDAAGIVREH